MQISKFCPIFLLNVNCTFAVRNLDVTLSSYFGKKTTHLLVVIIFRQNVGILYHNFKYHLFASNFSN